MAKLTNFTTILNNNKILNSLFEFSKKMLKAFFKNLDVFFAVLFFLVKFVLPNLVIPKNLLNTFTELNSLKDIFPSNQLNSFTAVNVISQETILLFMLTNFIVRFTIKISVLFVSAIIVFAVATFSVYLYLGVQKLVCEYGETTSSPFKQKSSYRLQIQFLN